MQDPLRILHTSDWHLGQELHGFSRTQEHDRFLDWLIGICQSKAIDAVLITGDVYDVVNPDLDAQARFYRFLDRALHISEHLQLIIIGGNHDSAGRLELPRELLDSARVAVIGAMPHLAGNTNPAACLVALRDLQKKVKVVCGAVPYLRPGDLSGSNNPTTPAELYRLVYEAAKSAYPNIPVVLTGHLHVIGGDVSETSERRILIGGEEAVDVATFPPDVTFVALGHLHKPQQVSETVRYAGSPLPMSIAEKNYHHSVTIVEIDGFDAQMEVLPTPRPVQFLRVPATGAAHLNDVIAELRKISFDDPGFGLRPFLEIAVTLDGPQPDLRRQIDAALESKPVRLTRIVRPTVITVKGKGGVTTRSLSIHCHNLRTSCSIQKHEPGRSR